MAEVTTVAQVNITRPRDYDFFEGMNDSDLVGIDRDASEARYYERLHKQLQRWYPNATITITVDMVSRERIEVLDADGADMNHEVREVEGAMQDIFNDGGFYVEVGDDA